MVIVLVTVLFATFALMAFMDKASTDLIVASRESTSRRLRVEAYSALETTLAVLQNFRTVSGPLRSPAEGWTDPLGFASWTPEDGHTVDVAFEDETGKIPLPRADAVQLTALFTAWDLSASDAERLTDALLNWMKKDYVGTVTPDYDAAAIPYAVPARSMRSFSELAAIDVARDMLYDENGRPNDLYRRFVADVSLFNYPKPNLNSAPSDVQIALGALDPIQQGKLNEYFTGTGAYTRQGPGYLTSAGSALPIMGGQASTTAFDVQIRALRIHITVQDGKSVYRLNVVVAPAGGATTVEEAATNKPGTASASATGSTTSTTTPTTTTTNSTGAGTSTSAANATTTTPNLNYPFTLLEIRENDEPMPVAPPPSAVPGSP
jgi:hypothetical protein